jgi:hypothetical protein
VKKIGCGHLRYFRVTEKCRVLSPRHKTVAASVKRICKSEAKTKNLAQVSACGFFQFQNFPKMIVSQFAELNY